jgi:DNA-binding LacI/PurR family transcriptional regulator
MARVTLQTIADRLGVSRMTVSNAFSRPDQLSEELRTRILATADELGYVGPDPTARALARGASGAVGVVLTDSLRVAFTDQVATAFLGAVADELAPTGFALTLLTSGGLGNAVPARDVALDGAIIYSCEADSPSRQWLMRRKLPLVFVDQDPVAGIPSVNVDDRGGARAAAQHLIDLGHRRVAIVNGAGTVGVEVVEDPLATVQGHPPRQRMLGWLDALGPVGIIPSVVQSPHESEDDATKAGTAVLALNPRPSAVLCFSDVLALGVVRAARLLGLDVPHDLSIVGFDDTIAARISEPTLTTVRQDVHTKGRLAASALVTVIDAARTPAAATAAPRARHRLLPTELVVRDSTAPPRARGSRR